MSAEPGPTRLLLFDFADTLVGKPGLIPAIAEVLGRFGRRREPQDIRRAQRFARELLSFPDATGRAFYRRFNERFLNLLGVLPEPALLDAVYEACRGLPWEAFEDVSALGSLGLPLGIVSNWDRSLPDKVAALAPGLSFSPIVGSAALGSAKPSTVIYLRALEEAGLEPGEVLYFGDSVWLDIAPARRLGMRACLVDRHGLYPSFDGLRISSFHEVKALIEGGPEGA